MESTIRVYALIQAITVTMASLTLYVIIHEIVHAISAYILGCKVKPIISSDGVLPSLGLKVSNNCDTTVKKVMVLYAPYLTNILAIMAALLGLYPSSLKSFSLVFTIIAVTTLPAMLLEDENFIRRRITKAIYPKKTMSKKVTF